MIYIAKMTYPKGTNANLIIGYRMLLTLYLYNNEFQRTRFDLFQEHNLRIYLPLYIKSFGEMDEISYQK